MRIMHMISGGDVGGAKTHVLSLLQGLARTQEIRLICFMDGAFAAEAKDMGIDTLVLKSRNIFSVVNQLVSMICLEGYEIVHCHGSRANLTGVLIRYKIDVPMVTTVHSDYRLDYLGRPMHRLIYGTINTICVRKIPYHIGVSDAMSSLLISRGFDPQSMFSIYNGVSFSPITPRTDRENFLKSLGLRMEPDNVVFGIAARLSAVKDVSTLIRGFSQAVKQIPEIRLVIAGDGEQRKELERLAADLCPAGSYVFAGWIEDTDSFYHAIDVNCLTSLSETFPYVLTEGARMHCATIASAVGGVPHLIEDGISGLLFEPKQDSQLAAHMIKVASSKSLRLMLGERLYQRASERFSIDATVKRQIQIYQTIYRRENRPRKEKDGVLICGAYGKGNAGDDSILEAIIQQLRHIDQDLPIYVLSRQPKQTMIQYGIGAIHTFALFRFLLRMRKTKLYISGGGSLIQDVTSTRSLQYYLCNMMLANLCGNKVLMYGCGIGPVSEQNKKYAGKIIDRYAHVITLRDPHSLKELENMGVHHPDIRLTADPALLLEQASSEQVNGFLLRHGMEPKGNYAMFVLRPWDGIENKLQYIAAQATRLFETRKMVPVFFALEPNRDMEINQKASKMVNCPSVLLSAPHNGRLIVGIMGKMQVVISMRLHALIFAAGQGIPLVGIVYDPKVSSFLDYVHQNRYLSINDMSGSTLKQMVDSALDDNADQSNSASGLRLIAEKNELAARQLLEDRV